MGDYEAVAANLPNLLLQTGLWTPQCVKRNVNTNRIGLFGSSLGGSGCLSTIATTGKSSPFVASANLDGGFFASPNTTLDDLAENKKPFLLVATPMHLADYNWDYVWPKLRSVKEKVTINGTTHVSFTDAPTIVGVLGIEEKIGKDAKDEFVGAIEWKQLITDMEMLLGRFFGRWV